MDFQELSQWTQTPTPQTGQSILTQTKPTTTQAAQTTTQIQTDGTTTAAKTTKLPIQLEFPLFTESGSITKKHQPCSSILDGILAPGSIPGLDASLCKCPTCTNRAADGIWWFDAGLRERIIKRIIPYCFEGGIGDVAVESGKG
jgi:hypothetical protein